MREFNEWAQLVERYQKEYKKYLKVCHFCSENLTPENVNQECKVDKETLGQNFQGFCKNYKGGRGRFHWFGFPNEDIFKTGQAYKNLQNVLNTQRKLSGREGSFLVEME